MNKHPKVLIVDDEDSVRESLRAYFEDEGFEIEAVDSVESGAQLLSMFPDIDVCIMDLRLPGFHGTDGIKAYKRIKPDLICFIHTGSIEFQPGQDMFDVGITEERIFRKPVSDLEAMIKYIKDVYIQEKQSQ